jgi:choline dehydrogenase-like flavoprotein
MDHPLVVEAAKFTTDNWPADGVLNFYGGQTKLENKGDRALLFATFAPTTWHRSTSYFGNYRAWVGFGNKKENDRKGGINLCWEQMPYADNRVTLSSGLRDPVFFDPLPEVKLELKPFDDRTVSFALMDVTEVLINKFKITGAVTPTDNPPELKGEHAMGTTRMAAGVQDGVVDENCKMHKVDNLFIAGGSVMPTAGWANPTLTIVALALRLADHLKTR